jgi:hypothetical protein
MARHPCKFDWKARTGSRSAGHLRHSGAMSENRRESGKPEAHASSHVSFGRIKLSKESVTRAWDITAEDPARAGETDPRQPRLRIADAPELLVPGDPFQKGWAFSVLRRSIGLKNRVGQMRCPANGGGTLCSSLIRQRPIKTKPPLTSPSDATGNGAL